jgi:hypothetical protein
VARAVRAVLDGWMLISPQAAGRLEDEREVPFNEK